jgi:DsbC/DsbD-like thiol-disulfide interchange protein
MRRLRTVTVRRHRRLSPSGAKVCSQRRKPLVSDHPNDQPPKGATEPRLPRCLCRPAGALGEPCTHHQGLTPLATDRRPSRANANKQRPTGAAFIGGNGAHSLLIALLLCTTLGTVSVCAAVRAAERGSPAGKTPKATVELLADQAAVAPGRPVTLALQFKIDKDWHIYWRNPGEAGKPPSVKWKLPPGFQAGPLQFPAPRRYPTPVGDSYVLEGQPVLLVELKVPNDAPVGKKVEIAGLVDWLVCKESCILEKQNVSLMLPVEAKDAPPRPANETLFQSARRFMPVPAADAQYLKLKTVASVDKLRPKDEAKVALVLDINNGFHIQSNKPLTPGFIPTAVFTDIVPGLTIDEPIFPPARKITVPEFGEVAEFTGRTVIVIPIKANIDLKGPDVRVTGVLTYQACDDKTGQCFFPQNVEWGITIPVAGTGAPVKPINTGIFASAAAPPGGTGKAPGETAAPPPQLGPTARGFSLERPIQPQFHEARHPLWMWLILAAVAGLVLNITPCVLPVISIKILSFVQQAQESPARVLKLGLAFAAGMMIVFNVLAALATGANLVWGQHFRTRRSSS